MQKENIWNLFAKTGDLNFYMLYKEYDTEFINLNNNFHDYSFCESEENVVLR